MLLDPASYFPDTEDLTQDKVAREYWLQCFEQANGKVGSHGTQHSVLIGRESVTRENEAGAVWGRKSIFSMLFCFLVVITEMFPNSVFQLYCPKDYYKHKQWNTLPVTIITEIMNFNRLLWWLPWQ